MNSHRSNHFSAISNKSIKPVKKKATIIKSYLADADRRHNTEQFPLRKGNLFVTMYTNAMSNQRFILMNNGSVFAHKPPCRQLRLYSEGEQETVEWMVFISDI